MQVCKVNPKRKQVFEEELEGDRIMMEHDGTVAKASLRRRGSRATVLQAQPLLGQFQISLRDKFQIPLKDSLIGEGYPHLYNLLRFLNKIFALVID